MEKLNSEIDVLKDGLLAQDKFLLSQNELDKNSMYPFNKYANIFSVLLSKGNLSYEEYVRLRGEYFGRNPNLDKFEMAPRTFGQTWGEDWLKLQKKDVLIDPPKKDGYTSQFDLWLPLENDTGIKIEVKSSHVAEKDPERILAEKAYKKPKGHNAKEEIEKLNFEMNFQQLKPSCCNVFVWIAVWLDDIDIWVIPASKIIMRPTGAKRRKPSDSIVRLDGCIYMGTQHQGGKGGDVPEGQIFVTNKHYKDLDDYKVTLDNLIQKIKEAWKP